MNLSGYHKLVKLGKPVIIFMHDMWTITGGCHHSFDCDKYKNECSDCPGFEGKERFDWVKREFRRKGKIYKNYENLYFVTPSNWLFGCVTNAALTINKPVFRIPNIVDENIYKSVNRRFARQLLNLDPEEIIVAFGAFTISSPYKGWSELEIALNLLHEFRDLNNMSVLIFGGEYNKVLAESIPFKTRFLGFLKDEYSTVLVYNAADVFVSPSLADNLPTTILECLACGTPVTGFEIGGIPDMIDHKKNGYLAKYRDPEDLAEGIRYCINSKIQGRLLPEFRKENIMARHLDLLHNLKGQ
jgi:glycosyltransferase involved in cell wall biosynthesis